MKKNDVPIHMMPAMTWNQRIARFSQLSILKSMSYALLFFFGTADQLPRYVL